MGGLADLTRQLAALTARATDRETRVGDPLRGNVPGATAAVALPELVRGPDGLTWAASWKVRIYGTPAAGPGFLELLDLGELLLAELAAKTNPFHAAELGPELAAVPAGDVPCYTVTAQLALAIDPAAPAANLGGSDHAGHGGNDGEESHAHAGRD